MTSPQKSKGYYYEKKTEELLNSIPGCHAKRQLASGAYGKLDERLDGDIIFSWRNHGEICDGCKLYSKCRSSGDLKDEIDWDNDPNPQLNEICLHNKDYKVEVKARKGDFPKWIEHACTQGDIVALWKCANGGSKGYVLMPIETFAEVVG